MWCLFFMGALRVNSSLDTWEIKCISCEALSLFIQFLSWLTTLPCLRCLDDFHDCLDSLTLYVLDVAHSFHSLRFIEKYVNVFCACLSLFDVSRFVLCSAFWFCPGVQKAKCGGIWCVIIFSYFLPLSVTILITD